MTLVVDASILVAVITTEAHSVAARALIADEGLVAPNLIIAECANALWKKTRGGMIDSEAARSAIRDVSDLFARLLPIDELAAAALDLAVRRDHAAYDCFYVVLAQREGAPLITADRRLAERFADDADIRLLA